MNLNFITFSIIIPTYNRESFIEKSIKSVLNQSYQNFELIVVDDGSTDNTEEVVKKINSPKLFYYKTENAERGAARNFAIRKSKGNYVTFLDSDDLFLQNHLSIACHYILRINHPEIFCLNNSTANEENIIIKKKRKITGDLNNKLIKGNIFGCMGIFIRKDIADSHPFIEDRRLAGTEDWELWLRLASRYRFYYSNEATSLFVNHKDRSVLNADEKKLQDRTEMLIHYLSQDNVFIKKNSSRIYKIKAHMLSYTALHLSLSNKSAKAFYYLFKAFLTNPFEIFTRRTIAILRISVVALLK